jgi:hypothetical protein
MPGMGSTRPEREIARARAAYVGAAERFVSAVGLFVATGVPLGPRSGDTELPAWSRADVTALLTLEAALAELISTRRMYDGMRRHG